MRTKKLIDGFKNQKVDLTTSVCGGRDTTGMFHYSLLLLRRICNSAAIKKKAFVFLKQRLFIGN